MNTLLVFGRRAGVRIGGLLRGAVLGAGGMGLAVLLSGAPVPTPAVSTAPGGLGLVKDGQLVEMLVPASGLTPDAAAATAARDPQAFARMVAGELATEALGGGLDAATTARNAKVREAAQVLIDLREAVRSARRGDARARATARGAWSAHGASIDRAFQVSRQVLEEIGARLAQVHVPAEIAARHQAGLAALERGREALRAALEAAGPGGTAELERLEQLLDELAGPTPDLSRLGPTLQTEWLAAPELSRAEADRRLAASAPTAGARGVSAMEIGEESATAPPTAADLAATVDVPLTPEIYAQAAALNNSPVAIYEFVRNSVAFQPYLGSRKAAVETLHQLAGNDTDQASLLIALLRAAGVPSRYVRGTVEMTPANAMSWLGVDHAATAGSILTTAGMDGVNILDGSTVAAIRCTRVWVEAWVPYSNYRGVPNSALGSTWVPLDPAFKGTTLTPGQDVLTPMGFNTDAYLDAYISTFHPLSPIEQFVANIQTYLNGAQPGTTVAQIERRTQLASQGLGYLPASLPNELRLVSSRFSELEDAKRYKVRFRLYNGGTTFIDHTLNLSALAGHRLNIDYVGATPADQTTIDSFGGVYKTPPNLVNVKPRLKLDGTVLVASTNTIGLARTHSSDMHFLQPAGASNVQPLIQNTIIAGNTQAIGFDTFLDLGDTGLFPAGLASTNLLETLLHGTAIDYLGRVNRGMERVGRIMGVVTTQDVSEAILESAVKVSYSFGVPVSWEWAGLIVDADRRIVGTFPVDGNHTKDVPFMKLTGYDGSTMENRVFEDLFGQPAVSTIKILELSSDMSIPWYRIVTSIAADAPGLSQPPSVVSAINNALAQGHHVIIPRTGITVGIWSGTGYIDLTPSTGAAGYIISGGISGNVIASGGATVQSWPIFLPCTATMVTGNVTSPSADTPDPSAMFSADEEVPLNFVGTLTFTCSDGTVQTQPLNKTTTLTIKQIADKFGAGDYNFVLFAVGTTQILRKITIAKIFITEAGDFLVPGAPNNAIRYNWKPVPRPPDSVKLEVLDKNGAIVRTLTGLPTTLDAGGIAEQKWNACQDAAGTQPLTEADSAYKLRLVGKWGAKESKAEVSAKVEAWLMDIKVNDAALAGESLVTGPDEDSIKDTNFKLTITLDGGAAKAVLFDVAKDKEVEGGPAGNHRGCDVTPKDYLFYTTPVKPYDIRYKLVMEQLTSTSAIPDNGLELKTVIDGTLNPWDMDPGTAERQIKGTWEFGITSSGAPLEATRRGLTEKYEK